MGQFNNDKLKIIFKKIKPHKQLHKDINLTEAIKALLRVIMMANNSYWQFFYHLFRSKLVRSIHQQCNSILLFEWKPPNKQPHTFYSNCKRSKYFRTISWMFHFLFTHSVCRPADQKIKWTKTYRRPSIVDDNNNGSRIYDANLIYKFRVQIRSWKKIYNK